MDIITLDNVHYLVIIQGNMKRELQDVLIQWKNQAERLPLILRGARQVGKSYLVENFGSEHFKSVITLNFELQPSLGRAFEALDPFKIISTLEILTNRSIRPGECLLFFDEIQECPKALLSLRYFKEKLPQLHVIGAGSLLEFTLQEEKFSFPVGRVQFIYLKPLSFQEFLDALGENKIIEYLSKITLSDQFESGLHEHILILFKQYLLVGGMPAAVKAFVESKTFLESYRIHQALLQSYQSDFGKYSTKAQHKYLQRFFEKAPGVVGQHFKYVEIDPEARSRELKVALQQLTWSGLVHCIFETNASGIPLQSQVDEKKFKLLFLDVGLLQAAGKVNPQMPWEEDILQIRSGALAEQVVGQELLAYQDCYETPHLYFWKREKKNSSAEVDYVVQVGSRIMPIEVKSGKGGHLKSLHKFMEEKKAPMGLKISAAPLSLDGNILSVPFYLIKHIPRLLAKLDQ